MSRNSLPKCLSWHPSQRGLLVYDGFTMAPVKHILSSIGTSEKLVEWRVKRICESIESSIEEFIAGKITKDELADRASARILINAHLNVLQKHADQGNKAHSAIESIAAGDEDTARKQDAKTVDRFLQFKEKRNAEILFSEEWCINPKEGYCAKSDIGLRFDNENWILDKKPKARIFFENRLQVTAQRSCPLRVQADGTVVENKVDRFGILINSGTAFEIEPVESELDAECWKLVKSLYFAKSNLDQELRK